MKRPVKFCLVWPDAMLTQQLNVAVLMDEEGREYVRMKSRPTGDRVRVYLDEPDTIFLTRRVL